jgi:Glyoxalase superfamily protein
MNSYLDAKAMAKALRKNLAERKIDLSHSECLELVARQFGLADWNTLAARIDTGRADNRDLVLPRDWYIAGKTEPGDYRLGLDPTMPNTALIESRRAQGEGADLASEKFAVLLQIFKADEYRGRNLRLTASLRTESAHQATIWMRIDGPERVPLRFDNLTGRSEDGRLSGTTDWTERSILLDVPKEADRIIFGFFLHGHGKVWARDFCFDCDGAAVSASESQRALLPAPMNLTFTEGLLQGV